MSDVSAADLTSRIHAVEKEVAAVRKAINSGRNTRLLILLLLVAFVVGMSALFYQLVARVRSNAFQQELLAEAQTHLENNTDTYSREMQRLVDHTTPVLTKALQDQAERDTRKYSEVIAEQRKTLVVQLKPELSKMVERRYEASLQGLETVIAQEFPEASDPVIQARLHKSLQRTVRDMVAQYYLDEMETQVELMAGIWNQFPAADPPEPDEPPAASQLIGYMLEILSKRLTSPAGV